MAKILGLDLGTNSIGWAIVDERENTPLLNKGVVIFQEGVKVEKGTEKSRAAERTESRSARRIKFRRKLRKYETLHVLAVNKMCPIDLDQIIAWRKSNFKDYPNELPFLNWLKTDEKQNKNPYFFRDKYSRKKYDWETEEDLAQELGRAFYHIAQRRGFKSNRLEQSDENIISSIKEQIQDALHEAINPVELISELDLIFADFDFDNRKKEELNATEQKLKQIRAYLLKILANKIKNKDYREYSTAKAEIDRYINRPENLGAVKGNIKLLSANMEKNNCQTLGQYFWMLYNKDRTVSNHKIRNNYTSRDEHYLEEFNYISKVQNIPADLKKKLEKAIFYQRPLKSQKGLVGYCTLEPSKPRCPISRPEFEAFRMWSFINTIKIKRNTDERLRFLTSAEKEILLPKFLRLKTTFKFNDLAKALEENNQTSFIYYKHTKDFENENLINYKLDTTVNGCPVMAYFNQLLGSDWKNESISYTITIPNGTTEEKTADYAVLWHVLSTFDSTDKLYEYAFSKLGFNEKTAKKFSKKTLPQGYGNLSLKAINTILPWLKKGLKYNHAVFLANIKNVVKPIVWQNEKDRELITETIGEIIDNHSIEKGLTNAVNGLIAEYKEDKTQYSKESESILKAEFETKIELLIGKDKWRKLVNNHSLFEKYFQKLKDELNKGSIAPQFIAVDRIDDLIGEFLDSNNLIEEKSDLTKLYHPSDLESFKPIIAKKKSGEPILINNKTFYILGSPRTGSIKNPVLMRAMHQMRKLINELIKQEWIDEKTKIHIELAREVNDSNKRAAYKKWQDDKRNENEEIETIIVELFKETGKSDMVTSEDIKKVKLWTEQLEDKNHKPLDIFTLTKSKKVLIEKYKLWKEQKGICIYTGKTINISQLFDGNSFDIEHTLPRSISWDNSMENKTIADAKYNRSIKRNNIPYDLADHKNIVLRIAHWEKRYLKLGKEINAINAAGMTDKTAKDSAIQKRHLLKFERDYWYNKYNRFTLKEVKEGFKNSQLVDTGLITRYAKTYLSGLFKNKVGNPNVRIVKGAVVDEFRKSWGIQEEYEKKSRANHIHHCIDAITIACMTKPKYDAFVAAWRKNEEEYKNNTKYAIATPKPWKKFTTDIADIKNDIVVVRDYKDKTPIHSKKKVRKRGKIQYKICFEKDSTGNYVKNIKGLKIPLFDKNGKRIFELDKDGNRIPLMQQGDTARGSLHQDSFYGAIKQVDRDESGTPKLDENGGIVLKKDKKGKDEITYVIRKKRSDLKKKTDLEKIVDPNIRAICLDAFEKEKLLRKDLEQLKKDVKNATDNIEEKKINSEITALTNKIENELYVIPPRKGKTVFMPIRKVRVFAANVKNPLPNFKSHRDLSKHPHKQEYHVQNDTNYCLVIYENEDKTKRKAEIINQITAATYFKKSNQAQKNNGKPLFEEKIKGLKLKGILRTNLSVLFYQERPEEIWDLDKETLLKRLYYVRVIPKSGQVSFQHHQEARIDEQLKEDYEKEFHEKAPPLLTIGVSFYDFDSKPAPKLSISPKNMTILIENVDFKINVLGEIEQL